MFSCIIDDDGDVAEEEDAFDTAAGEDDEGVIGDLGLPRRAEDEDAAEDAEDEDDDKDDEEDDDDVVGRVIGPIVLILVASATSEVMDACKSSATAGNGSSARSNALVVSTRVCILYRSRERV